MTNIAFYGSHNGSIALERDGEILEVIELERFNNIKNSGYGFYLPSMARDFLLKEILLYIKDKYDITYFDTLYHQNTECHHNGDVHYYFRDIPARNYVYGQHHMSHVLNSLYQSPHQEALVASLSGALAFSTGSACTSDKIEPSHVLLAIGSELHNSIRMSLGRETQATNNIGNLVITAYNRIREFQL